MYQSFYGLREKPFSLLPDPGFLFPSEKHQMAMAMLEYAVENHSSFAVVTGGIGTGKTTLVRHLLNQLDRDVSVGLITNTHSSFGELLQWILLAFNLECDSRDKVEMYHRFTDYLIAEYAAGRRTVLIVDEAQNLPPTTLEELRMLSNVNSEKDQVLQIILVGQPGLRDTLRGSGLEQFAQRIAVDYHLDALAADETRRYIEHRVAIAGGRPDLFDPEACAAVYQHSGGIPRLINLLCDTALVYGYASHASTISVQLVEEIANEKRKGGLLPLAPQAAVRMQGDAPPNQADDSPSSRTCGEPARPPLRVAVISNTESRRNHLHDMLNQCGMNVVASLGLTNCAVTDTDLHQPDIVFVELDDDVDQELRQLDIMLADCRRPVLFNDSSDSHSGLADRNDDYQKRLTFKLTSLTGR